MTPLDTFPSPDYHSLPPSPISPGIMDDNAILSSLHALSPSCHLYQRQEDSCFMFRPDQSVPAAPMTPTSPSPNTPSRTTSFLPATPPCALSIHHVEPFAGYTDEGVSPALSHSHFHQEESFMMASSAAAKLFAAEPPTCAHQKESCFFPTSLESLEVQAPDYMGWPYALEHPLSGGLYHDSLSLFAAEIPSEQEEEDEFMFQPSTPNHELHHSDFYSSPIPTWDSTRRYSHSSTSSYDYLSDSSLPSPLPQLTPTPFDYASWDLTDHRRGSTDSCASSSSGFSAVSSAPPTPELRHAELRHADLAGKAGVRKRKRGSKAEQQLALEGGAFVCPHPGCEKEFPRMYNLKSHLLCHSNARPHSCDLCPAAFARKHDLQRHLRTLHSESRPFKCDTCKQGFPRADALKKHKQQENHGSPRAAKKQKVASVSGAGSWFDEESRMGAVRRGRGRFMAGVQA
ncbi:Metallothionein expression activator [Rhizophlyctis rosea]|uniref:Metallothionein expression activator n=1 Tax=Rhizophlyctis rosea TaxID=64517 RepID=A0AAD5X153_9FUNG|nr:Metallothionein expression activator [Rhizophlyctis rosea]